MFSQAQMLVARASPPCLRYCIRMRFRMRFRMTHPMEMHMGVKVSFRAWKGFVATLLPQIAGSPIM